MRVWFKYLIKIKQESLILCLGYKFKFMNNSPVLERHPWQPFVPDNAKVLIMGTFPPQPHRWRMNFYYPNPTNDFWRVMGLIFYGDKLALYDTERKEFDLAEIKVMLNREGIALSDTGHKIRRLKGNASDKYLEIVEPVDLQGLLDRMPGLTDIATTGEKAAGVVASLTGSKIPPVGSFVQLDLPERRQSLRVWRMPSTSRAYPLAVEKKAAAYARLFASDKSTFWER